MQKILPIVFVNGVYCNINCIYCYHRKLKRTEKTNTINSSFVSKIITDIVEYNYGFDNIEILWHGGEPMLAGIDFYKMVLEVQRKYKNIIFENSIQTNGTLINDKWAEFFKKHNFSVGISLDGPKFIHDTYRIYNNRTGTFDDVMQGIRLLRKYKIDFGIVSAIHKKTTKYASEYYSFFKDENIKQFILNPCFESKKINGHLENFCPTPKEFAKFAIDIFELWFKDNDPYIRIGYLRDILENILTSTCECCYLRGGCKEFIVIDQNGNVLPCDRLFGKIFILGNINKSSLIDILSSDKYISLYNNISKRRKECRNCNWYSICKGSCPHLQKGDINSKNWLCEANKIVFPHILKRVGSEISL